MSSFSFYGIIVFVIILVVGLIIKTFTGKRIDELNGFGGIINTEETVSPTDDEKDRNPELHL